MGVYVSNTKNKYSHVLPTHAYWFSKDITITDTFVRACTCMHTYTHARKNTHTHPHLFFPNIKQTKMLAYQRTYVIIMTLLRANVTSYRFFSHLSYFIVLMSATFSFSCLPFSSPFSFSSLEDITIIIKGMEPSIIHVFQIEITKWTCRQTGFYCWGPGGGGGHKTAWSLATKGNISSKKQRGRAFLCIKSSGKGSLIVVFFISRKNETICILRNWKLSVLH